MKTPVIAIMAIYNEEGTVQNACRQLHRCGVDAIVTIFNGCTDQSLHRIKELQKTLDCVFWVEQFERPLGHDVSRAVGTYAALRKGGESSVLLYIDADWAGSFGPNLAEFVHFGEEKHAEVLSITQNALSENGRRSATAELWESTLASQSIIPTGAAPFLLPMWVHSSVFRKLSPIWLAHPGLWLASAIKARLRWCIYEPWTMEMVGHRTRTASHRQALEKRLQQDAQDANRILRGLHTETSFATVLSCQKDSLAGHFPEKQLPHRDFAQLLRYASAFSC